MKLYTNKQKQNGERTIRDELPIHCISMKKVKLMGYIKQEDDALDISHTSSMSCPVKCQQHQFFWF